MGPREGRGEVANRDFVPFAGVPRECRDYVVIPPICAPPPRKVGLRWPILILFPLLGTPENAGIT